MIPINPKNTRFDSTAEMSSMSSPDATGRANRAITRMACEPISSLRLAIRCRSSSDRGTISLLTILDVASSGITSGTSL